MATPYINRDSSARARAAAAGRKTALASGQPAEENKQQMPQQQLSPLQSLMQGVNLPNPEVQTPSRLPEGGYKDNRQMLDDLISRPISPDEVEKRKRAATQVAAVGQLGSLLSAYANLAGTSGGAAPQSVSSYQGPDTGSWEDRARQKQMEYASIMNGFTSEAWERAYKEHQAAVAQQNAERDYRLKADDLEYKRQYQAHRDTVEDAQKEAALLASERHNRATEAISQQNANTSAERVTNQMERYERDFNAKRGLNADGTPVTHKVKGADGNIYDIDESQLYYKLGSGNNGTGASATARQLYSKLPQDIKDRYRLSSWQDLNKDAATAAAAISEGMETDKTFFEEARKYGLIASRQEGGESGWWSQPAEEKHWWNK